ncbi:MAG: acetyltransferase [Brachymonas sp.]|nr:acetyltransferase [Brachymonas sp.]
MKKNESVQHIGLVGTGGYAREVMPLLQEYVAHLSGKNTDLKLWFVDVAASGPVNGVPVIAEEAFLALDGGKKFNIAIADSLLRKKIADKYEKNGCEPIDIWAKNSTNLAANTIAPGAIVSPFSCITANAKIGRYFHCNIYSYVAHDCVIGDFVTFAPKVCCNGAVIIEDHAYIGAGAIIKQGTPAKPVVIGKGAVVGMGAVVTKSVPEGAIVVGNPAKPLAR